MKTLCIFISIVVAIPLFAAVVVEDIEYGSDMAGAIWRVEHIKVDGDTEVTNEVSHIWYPSSIQIVDDTGNANTCTVSVVRSIVVPTYQTELVETNEVDGVVTNDVKIRTGETEHWVETQIAEIPVNASSSALSGEIEPVPIQHGDVLKYSLDTDTNLWITIAGER